MRIFVACALIAVLGPAAAGAEPAEFFRKGPYLQHEAADAVVVVWEGTGARAGEVELLDTGKIVRVEPAVRHKVRIDGLTPGERYRYEVRAGDNVARGQLQAPPPTDAPIAFAVFGNTRQDERVHRLIASRVRGQRPDFLLGTGNMVSDGLSEHDWNRFFAIQRELLRDTPLVPALGRHDLQGRRRSAEHVQEFFVLPEGAPTAGRYHALSYGPARIVVLDSNERQHALSEQTRWLERELAAARADDEIERIFVVSHHAPYSVGLYGGDERIRDAWAPLFEQHGVDAVFSGHDHVYSRAEAGGVRYFVTGGGGAPLYRRDRQADHASQEAIRHFESVHHYLRVDVGGGLVEVSAVRLDGTLIETVRWGEPTSPGPSLAAEVEAFLTPPAPPAPVATAPASAAAEGPRHRGRLGLGWLGVGLAVAGGGALAWTLRRQG